MSGKPLPQRVDDFFRASKRLTGHPGWREGTRTGERRCQFGIIIDKTVSPHELVVKAYPFSSDGKFNIVLIWPPRIFGLDYEPQGGHTNPFGSPNGPIVKGAHAHHWVDNRHRATRAHLPEEMKEARSLSPQIRRLDQAFRWFCEEANIMFQEEQVPEYPPKELLL